MRRTFLIAVLAIAVGIGAAEYLTRSFAFRRWLGHFAERGELLALFRREGIYDTDVARAWQAELYLSGAVSEEIDKSIANEQRDAALQKLIIQARLDEAAAREAVNPAAVDHAMALLRWQFRDEKTWSASLGKAGAARGILKREVAANLRDRGWIEARIAQLSPNESEIERYYAEHRAAFQEPLRLRASHLFLAAPDGYPPEVIKGKRARINLLAKRLVNGESFPALVAEFSEDEVTKKRGGDLGYFAEERMLPEVFAAAHLLHPGETSAPVRSRLGFHLIRLTDSLPTRELTLDEARPEIVLALENRHRATAVAALLASLR